MMKNIDVFSAFAQALYDLENRYLDSITPNLIKLATQALKESVHFYMPKNAEILDKKEYTEELKEEFKLPYSCISVLSECLMSGLGDNPQMVKNITIAFNLDGEENKKYKWCRDLSPNGWAMISLTCHPFQKFWVLEPFLVFCSVDPNEKGVGLNPFPSEESENILKMYNKDLNFVINEFKPNMNTITNLCMLLSLNNVNIAKNTPPLKINIKRKKKGKRLFKEYHILILNNKNTNTRSLKGNGNGSSKRSHLRRGHIRRLGKGNNIWVNACLIKGNSPGYMEKGYIVKG